MGQLGLFLFNSAKVASGCFFNNVEYRKSHNIGLMTDLDARFLHHFPNIFITDLHADFRECRLQLLGVNVSVIELEKLVCMDPKILLSIT